MRRYKCFLCPSYANVEGLTGQCLWQDYEVVVLVGGGIGVTPFASVLADLVNRLNSNKCKMCKQVACAHPSAHTQ